MLYLVQKYILVGTEFRLPLMRQISIAITYNQSIVISVTFGLCFSIRKFDGLSNNLLCACVLSRVSHVRLFATPWTVTSQALLSVGFPRQGYWSGLPFPPPGGLPNPGIEPTSPMLAGVFFVTEPRGMPYLQERRESNLVGRENQGVYHEIMFLYR